MAFIIGTPHSKNAGYFRNDDTPSGGRKTEDDVQTCSHCQAVIKLRVWKNEGAWCSKCSKPLCTYCGARATIYGCEPFLKQLERQMGVAGRYEKFLMDSGRALPAASRPLVLTG